MARLVLDQWPREQMSRLLAEMDEAAQKLGPGEWPSNHPQIGGGVEPLREDIRNARLALERDPPSYFLAGSVTGACLYCHRP